MKNEKKEKKKEKNYLYKIDYFYKIVWKKSKKIDVLNIFQIVAFLIRRGLQGGPQWPFVQGPRISVHGPASATFPLST